MRWWLAAVLLIIAGLAACSKATTCLGCEGCCDTRGQCQAGSAHDACGQGGEACTDCVLQHGGCVARRCVPSPDGGGPGGGAGGGAGGGGGGDDAGATTYPDGGTLFRYWDGGSCAVKTDCPCFSSDDCGPGFTCHSEDATGTQVWCVPGARGAGLAGDPCTGEADCLSALCTDSSAGMRCSALCSGAIDCPAALPRCQYVGFGVERSLCAP